MAYTGPALNLTEFERDWEPAAQEAGLRTDTFGQSEGLSLPYAWREPAPGAPWLYLSAGIHGDEPAGTLALLAFLQEGLLPARTGVVAFPLLNPEGLRANTREHPQYGDLNRDYRAFNSPQIRAHRDCLQTLGHSYALAVCLHEDWESAGYYIYEHVEGNRPGLGRKMLDAVEPICGIDRAPVIEDRRADQGLITSAPGTVTPEDLDGGWAEALYLGEGLCPEVYTVEAPSDQDLDVRVRAHLAALKVAAAAECLRGH
ncbi:MAG: M14 family metallopeptidase [Puniceicoccales bacterium]